MPSSCPQISLWLLYLPYILAGLVVLFLLFFYFFSRRKALPNEPHPAQENKNDANDTAYAGVNLGYPIRVVVDSLPRAPAEAHKAKDQSTEIREKSKFFAEVITTTLALGLFVVTWFYTKYTYQMLCGMQTQIGNQTMQFAATQRPWLGIDGRPVLTKPVEIQTLNGKKVAEIQTLAYVKNFGNHVAQNLGYDARVFDPTNLRGNDDYSKQEEILADVSCRMADLSTGKGRGPYVFPSNTHFEMTSSTVPEDGLTEELKIIGCISYWDEVSKKTRHTRFCVHSRTAIPQNTPATVLMACEENQSAD